MKGVRYRHDTVYRLSSRGYPRRFSVFVHQAFDASSEQESVTSNQTLITISRIGTGILTIIGATASLIPLGALRTIVAEITPL